jgi:hypothetical protein
MGIETESEQTYEPILNVEISKKASVVKSFFIRARGRRHFIARRCVDATAEDLYNFLLL